jgi:hypothetical protein
VLGSGGQQLKFSGHQPEALGCSHRCGDGATLKYRGMLAEGAAMTSQYGLGPAERAGSGTDFSGALTLFET